MNLQKYKFRPQSGTKRTILRNPGYRDYHMHWYERRDYSRPGEPLNEQVLGRLFGRLHYLTSHAPARVSARWKQAEIRMRARVPSRRVSLNYVNTISAERLM